LLRDYQIKVSILSCYEWSEIVRLVSEDDFDLIIVEAGDRGRGHWRGPELVRALRALSGCPPILHLTGVERELQEGLDAGAQHVQSLPIHREQTPIIILELLNLRVRPCPGPTALTDSNGLANQ